MKKFLLCFLIVSTCSVFSQNFKGSAKDLIFEEPGYFQYTTTDKAGKTNVHKINITETVDVIIEFKDKPMFIQGSRGKERLKKEAHEQTKNKLLEDISLLSAKLMSGGLFKAGKPEAKRSFYKVMNGVNIEVPAGIISGISSLDYVKAIYKNQVYTVENDFKKIKGTNTAYSISDTAGKGIVIGILDSGIDYLHPALGGGFGPGFKVIGGYDVIDGDEDPMDTYGHGTHVAGIAAGNCDALKGVAPGAKLMAFKVLSESKITTSSILIEGIERALDPDNNDDFDDKVDIVNMSLGGRGTPDDAVATAVNNAVMTGTVFCISVGNSGQYKSIGSPGTAELAIGVGAKDVSDNTADYSSKGPTSKNYRIKPDVIAPGTEIISSLPGAEYGTNSGTSMAAPYVAGICAIIKSIHRDWLPEQIKSAVMNGTDLYNEPVMVQGAGVVNLNKILSAETRILPSSLSFGYCNNKEDLWIVKDSLVIKNLSAKTKNYFISTAPTAQFVSVSPSDFAIPAGDSVVVQVTLTVNNNNTPYISNFNDYSGYIDVSSDGEVIHLPWAFVKVPRLVVNFDTPATDLFLVNSDSYNMYEFEKSIWDDSFLSADLNIENGQYRLFAVFNQTAAVPDSFENTALVVKDISINNSGEIHISRAEAKNNIILKSKDGNGEIMSEKDNWMGRVVIVFPDEYPLTDIGFSIYPGTILSVPDLPSDYKIISCELLQDLTGEKKVYLSQPPEQKGITSNLTLSNNNYEFKKYNISILLSPFTEKHNLNFGINFYNRANFNYNSSIFPSELTVDSSGWSGSFCISNSGNNNYYCTTAIIADKDEDSYGNAWFYTGPLFLRNDSLGIIDEYSPDNIFIPENGTLNFGKGISVPNLIYLYMENALSLYYTSFGTSAEIRSTDEYKSEFSILDKNNNAIFTGNYPELAAKGYITLFPGEYQFRVKNRNYAVENTRGEFLLKNNFKTGDNILEGFNSDLLISGRINNSSGIPSTLISKNDKASLHFSLYHLPDMPAVKAFLKESGTNNWTELETAASDYGNYFHYVSDISAFTGYDSTSLDLKITLTSGEYITDYTWQPAVGIGDFKGTLDVENGTNILPASYRLYNNYPNPFNNATVIKYDLPNEAKVKLEIFSIIGERIATLYDGAQSAGTHEVKFNADNFASGVYIYRLTSEGKSFYQKSNKMILLK